MKPPPPLSSPMQHLHNKFFVRNSRGKMTQCFRRLLLQVQQHPRQCCCPLFLSSFLCWTMALPVVVFLLALTTLSATSAPDCKDLVKPFMPVDPKVIFGKWVYVMGAGDPKPYHKALESLKSSWIDLSPTFDNQILTLRWGDHCFNRCILGEVNATVLGLATTFRKNLSDHKGHILQTCSDCLLWTDTFRNGDVTGRYILQFTRTGNIALKDVEIFKKQLGCLNFPEKFHSYDGETELCPDDKESTE